MTDPVNEPRRDSLSRVVKYYGIQNFMHIVNEGIFHPFTVIRIPDTRPSRLSSPPALIPSRLIVTLPLETVVRVTPYSRDILRILDVTRPARPVSLVVKHVISDFHPPLTAIGSGCWSWTSGMWTSSHLRVRDSYSDDRGPMSASHRSSVCDMLNIMGYRYPLHLVLEELPHHDSEF